MSKKIVGIFTDSSDEAKLPVKQHSNKKWLIYVITGFLAACGIMWYFYVNSPGYLFAAAQRFEMQGKYKQAVNKYQKCADMYPNHEKASESLYRMAQIINNQFSDYVQAKSVYKKILERYSATSWAKLAKEEIRYCYDYFPLAIGNLWVEGDSESGGKNYLSEIGCVDEKEVNKEKLWILDKKIFAGTRLVTRIKESYAKPDRETVEYKNNRYLTVLKYPLQTGVAWTKVTGGIKVIYMVVSINETVTTLAGTFTDCVKIQQEQENLPGSWRYDYYAPDIGKVLTTTGSQRKTDEKRMSELIKYQVIEPK